MPKNNYNKEEKTILNTYTTLKINGTKAWPRLCACVIRSKKQNIFWNNSYIVQIVLNFQTFLLNENFLMSIVFFFSNKFAPAIQIQRCRISNPIFYFEIWPKVIPRIICYHIHKGLQWERNQDDWSACRRFGQIERLRLTALIRRRSGIGEERRNARWGYEWCTL